MIESPAQGNFTKPMVVGKNLLPCPSGRHCWTVNNPRQDAARHCANGAGHLRPRKGRRQPLCRVLRGGAALDHLAHGIANLM